MATESSFTWKGATIRAKELTVREANSATALMMRLPDAEREESAGALWTFAEFMTAADIEGDPPLTMVDVRSPQKEVEEALEAWLNLPARFQRMWRKAVAESEGGADPK